MPSFSFAVLIMDDASLLVIRPISFAFIAVAERDAQNFREIISAVFVEDLPDVLFSQHCLNKEDGISNSAATELQ